MKTPQSRLIIGLSAGALVALLALAAFHYTGPGGAVQGFYQDALVNHDAASAYGRLCRQTQDQTSFSQFQAGIQILQQAGVTFDLSKLTYSVTNENFFGNAEVHVGGQLTVSLHGLSGTFSLDGRNLVVGVSSSGLGWCLLSSGLLPTS